MQAESAFNAMAVSPVGALGLMQLMPEVAAELGADDPMDPRQNIMAGSQYLKQLLTAHRGNVKLALASYNAGPGAVAKYSDRIPPFKETRNYVKRVTALLADAQGAAEIPRYAGMAHERHHLRGEALHLLVLRAELQQQQIDAGRARSERRARPPAPACRPGRRAGRGWTPSSPPG